MKQRITSDQLKQLTPSQQDNLWLLWDPQVGDLAVITGDTLGHGITVLITKYHSEYDSVNFDFIDGDGFGSQEKKDLTPLLSVGQCIELIREYNFSELVKLDFNGAIQDENLIDALWESVKSIL